MTSQVNVTTVPRELADADRKAEIWPAFRIIFDVCSYRLRQFEMANLVATVSLMLVLRLSVPDLLVRSGFAFLLNALVYLTNDYCDLERDWAARRDQSRQFYLAQHRGAAVTAQWLLALSLTVVGAVWDLGLLIVGIVGAAICWVYSFKVKGIPYLDVLAMAVAGVAGSLVGVPLTNRIGWILVLELGLFSAVFQSIQVIRDHDFDLRAGIRTTAVAIGPKRAFVLVRFCLAASAVYAALLIHVWVALVILVATFLPLKSGKVALYWSRIRLVLGCAWLLTLASVQVDGTLDGLLGGPLSSWSVLGW